MVDTGYSGAQPFTTNYSPDGTVYWAITTGQADFNDTSVTIPKRNLNNLLDIYPLGDLVLRHIYASWEPSTSGAGIRGTLYAYTDTNTAATLKRVISLATVTDLEWRGDLVVTGWANIVPTNAIIRFSVPGGTVTTLDDIYFELEGIVYPRPESEPRNTALPVTLEGYKWPLTKRRV